MVITRVVFILVVLIMTGAVFISFASATDTGDAVRSAPPNGEWNSTGGLSSDISESVVAPGRLLIRYFEEYATDLPLFRQTCEESNAGVGAFTVRDYTGLGFPGLVLVELPGQVPLDGALEYYQSLPQVMYAEPDVARQAELVPNDPEFWHQWGLSNTGQVFNEGSPPGTAGADIAAPSAWETTTAGNGVIVAVLDSGVDYHHPDLIPNLWRDHATGTFGYDAIWGDQDPMDQASHGSHCTGIIGAAGDNGIGGTGVAWRAQVMGVRFLNGFGTGTVSDEIAGILWATQHGARIVSCSFGGREYSRAEYDVISRSDALFICAAGNSGADIDAGPYYPVCYDLPNIIGVAATTPDDGIADFSNYGAVSVDLGAPGVTIYSTKRCYYEQSPIWRDPMDSFANWTTHGNWTISLVDFTSPPASAQGLINRNLGPNESVPLVLTLKTPLDLLGINDPVLTYGWMMVALNWTFRVEASLDGRQYVPLDYGSNPPLMISGPYFTRSCRVPSDLSSGPLYLRFVADGDFVAISLDDIALSDGYGRVDEVRWGFMDGSSMACPQVSGVAAILASYAPEKPLSQIKEAILRTVDPLPALSGKTRSGGRVNLTAALAAVTPHPTPTPTPTPTSQGLRADFVASPRKGSRPLTVTFTDHSTGNPTQWYWSFGDGVSSLAQHPNHTYMQPGNYTIALKVTNGMSSYRISRPGYITVEATAGPTPPPTPTPPGFRADFTASPQTGPAPLTVTFTDESVGVPSHWYWSFGDGSSSLEKNPVHTYTKGGNYSISLEASSTGGRYRLHRQSYIKVA
ncbi:MAG: S8 family serine peptidase [Methanomicrobiales archaeon]|nr:S8 family serine peptidase [Methanomicrobiales archaeon]